MEAVHMSRSLAFIATLALCFHAGAVRAADPGAEAARAYALDTSASSGTVKPGQPGKLVVIIRPTAAGWHVHPQAPLKIRFEAPASLKLEKPELSRRDAVDAKAAAPRFETGFVAAAPGALEAKANVDFFICSDAACVKQTRTVAIPVAVK